MTDYIIEPREESCAICGNPNIYKYDGYCRPLCEKCAKGVVKPYIRNKAKIRRNDPCPCGSGLKYKHCCGK